MDPLQVQFLAEDEEITITPNFALNKLEFVNVSVLVERKRLYLYFNKINIVP